MPKTAHAGYPQIEVSGYKKWLYNNVSVSPQANYLSYVGSSETFNPVARIAQADENNSFIGIGVLLGKINDHIIITFIINGSPAQAVGLKAGDIITAIDAKPIEKQDLTDVQKMLKGEKGTAVKISIVRPLKMNAKMDFLITRQEITNPKENQLEGLDYTNTKLEVKIGSVERSLAPEPYGDEYKRQLAAINVSAPGAISYEAYILNNDKKIITRVYIEDGDYLGNGVEQPARWNEIIYDNPAEGVNSPSGNYIFLIKCFGANNQIVTAEKEIQLDVNPPTITLGNKIISNNHMSILINKDVHVVVAAYDIYGNEVEGVNYEGQIYEAGKEQDIKLSKNKIGYIWIKATDLYGNTSAKLVNNTPNISERVKKYYFREMAQGLKLNVMDKYKDSNHYNNVLLRSRELLSKGDPLKAILLLKIYEQKYPYADVIDNDMEIKKGFGAMAQMEIARIFVEYFNDYEQGIEEYRKAIKKYKNIEVGFIQAYRGPWGKCGIFALLKMANIYCNDLKDYKKAINIYHEYLKIYNDEWEGVWEYSYSFDLQVFNSIINISKKIYGGGDRTIEECKKVIAEAKNDDIACEALIKMAEIYEENEQYNKAIDTYTEIIDKYSTAEVTFPYDVSLNYASLAKIKILELYQEKLKNPKKTREYAEAIINNAKDQAIIDLAYKKLDELSSPDKRIVEKFIIKYELPKYAERFCLDEIVGEKDGHLYLFGGYDSEKIMYSWKQNNTLKKVGGVHQSIFGGGSTWRAWVSGVNNITFIKGYENKEYGGKSGNAEVLHVFKDKGDPAGSEYVIGGYSNDEKYDKYNKIDTGNGAEKWRYLFKTNKIHEVKEIYFNNKSLEEKIIYSSSATLEPIIDYVSDKSNLFILHPNYVKIIKMGSLEEMKIGYNDRKYDWPWQIWISPDSHYLIVLDRGGEQENTLKVIDLTKNDKTARAMIIKGQIKGVLFSRDNRYLLINKGREPFSYNYADYIPSKIDIYELSSMKNVKTIYVDGDALSTLLSNDGDRLWVLNNRDRPIISIVDLKKALK
ncbi:PDZ domain-containing protein [Candidatus Saganbacteria bacterium]|nr:PDZ domain-containing protein [Candidatus Saganbacteria bacterium]